MADDIKTISAVTTINVQGASNRNTNDNSNGKSLFIQRIFNDIAGLSVHYNDFIFINNTDPLLTIDHCVELVSNLYKDALLKNTSETVFRNILGQIGIESTAIEFLASSFYRLKPELVNRIKQNLASLSIASASSSTASSSSAADNTTNHSLINFDWTVAHVLASDTLAVVNEPLVQLSMNLLASTVDNNNHQKYTGNLSSSSSSSTSSSCLRLECNLQELNAMIQQLETANTLITK